MKGGCLCGAVRYTIKAFSPGIANCHCAMCRKFSGSAYGVFGIVEKGNITWLTGEDSVKEFASSDKARRGFCAQCGSSIYFRLVGPDADYEIALGSLDDEPDHPVDANIFYRYKPDWSSGFERLPCYDEGKEP